MAQALVPLKDLVAAKSRLSGVLSPVERRSLAQAMVEDVLTVLAHHTQISAVTLVSDDVSAAMIAAKYGINHWLEHSLACRGLNPIISRSCELLAQQSEQAIIVLHGDLPCLKADDISAVLSGLEQSGGLIVGCDRHERGTNLLAFATGDAPEFSFGKDSCARHCASAAARGISTQILRRPGIALDVDEPRDLGLLMDEIEQGHGGHTAALLSSSALGGRVRTQLASMTATAPTRSSSKGAVK